MPEHDNSILLNKASSQYSNTARADYSVPADHESPDVGRVKLAAQLPASAAPRDVLALQSVIGNRAASQVVHNKTKAPFVRPPLKRSEQHVTKADLDQPAVRTKQPASSSSSSASDNVLSANESPKAQPIDPNQPAANPSTSSSSNANTASGFRRPAIQHFRFSSKQTAQGQPTVNPSTSSSSNTTAPTAQRSAPNASENGSATEKETPIVSLWKQMSGREMNQARVEREKQEASNLEKITDTHQKKTKSELESLAPSKDKAQKPSDYVAAKQGTDAGDISATADDPRLGYQFNRSSDTGNWLSRKVKRGWELTKEGGADLWSKMPLTHSVLPGEDYATQKQSLGERAWESTKATASGALSKGVRSIPLIGSGVKGYDAYKASKKEDAAKQVAENASKANADPKHPSLLESMAKGMESGYHKEKYNKGVNAATSLVGDALSALTLGGSTAVTGPLSSALSSVVDVGASTVNSGLTNSADLTTSLVSKAMGPSAQESRKLVASSHDQNVRSEAVKQVVKTDPNAAKAMLKHLKKGQMSHDEELYTNTRIQQPKGEHTMKPSQVKQLGDQEKARLRLRENMGVDPLDNAGTKAENTPQVNQQAKPKPILVRQKNAKNLLKNDTGIPEAPDLPEMGPKELLKTKVKPPTKNSGLNKLILNDES